MPDATRRRTSTNRKMDEIMRLARRLPLTRQVLADQLETATPAQMEFVDRRMNAEIESRRRPNARACPDRPASPRQGTRRLRLGERAHAGGLAAQRA